MLTAFVIFTGCDSKAGPAATASEPTALRTVTAVRTETVYEEPQPSVVDVSDGVVTDTSKLESNATSETQEHQKESIFKMPIIGSVSLDPAVGDADFTESWFVYPEIYSGLMKIADDPSQPFQTDMAERYSVTDGGTRFEFVLKRGLKFSDGSPVVASDFKWSWERALNPSTKAFRAQRLLADIKGANDVITGTTLELTGVTIVDERTLTIQLRIPRPDFLSVLADPATSVLQRTNVENWGIDWAALRTSGVPSLSFNELPVGTGPFLLEEFELGGRILMIKNSHYHDVSPMIDGVEMFTGLVSFDSEDFAGPLNSAFRQGDIDATFYFGDDPQGDGAMEAPSRSETYFLTFNSGIAPYDDAHFRRALQHASNPHRWAQWYGETHATALVPPDLSSNNRETPVYPFSAEQAVAEIENSAYANSVGEFELVYRTNIGGLEANYAGFFEGWLDVLGVSAEYEVVSADRYLQLEESGELEMVSHYVQPRYPDPYAVMNVFEDLYGKQTVALEYADIRSAIDAAVSEQDAVARRELYNELEDYILNQALALPLFWRLTGDYWLVQPWVVGFNPSKYYGSTFKHVSFNENYPR